MDNLWKNIRALTSSAADIEEWPFSISEETFEEINGLCENPFVLRSAVKYLLNVGVQTVKNMTEEEISSLDNFTADFYRLMKRVVEITDHVDDIVSYCQVVGSLNPFKH